MDEISVQAVGTGRNVREQRMRPVGGKRVPAHVRDLEIAGGLDRSDIAADPAEALRRLVFEPTLRHQLHADANAEEGAALLADPLFERVDHARQGFEPTAAIGEGADAGQHDAVGPRHRFGSPVTLISAVKPASRAARSKALCAECRLPEP